MVVQHNMQAVNANRQLNITTGQQSKSTEKLSSGFKINRAADDAAGLSISEKMRKQVRGLDRASTNAQDGVSAVQTAEGALGEVHDMLQRMNELAVQAANGTNSVTDRKSIQDEIDQLTTEIDRVSETTKFNETYLLKGDRTAPMKYSMSYKVGTATAATISSSAGSGVVKDTATGLQATIAFNSSPDGQGSSAATAADQNAIAKSIRDSGIVMSKTSMWEPSGSSGSAQNHYSFELTGDAAQKYDVVSTDDRGTSFKIQTKDGKEIATVTMADSGGTAANLKAATATQAGGSASATASASSATAAHSAGELDKYYDANGNAIAENALESYFSVDASGNAKPRSDAPKVYDALGNQTFLENSKVTATKDKVGDLSLKLHVGADSTDNNQIQINIGSMSAKNLGVSGLKIDGNDDTNAKAAITTISAALQQVSDQRGALGAVQNRLEHTINNLDNVVENTTAAESRIRDTDIAEEMVTYSKNNILAQAGQSMLAQANQSTQGALSLLG